MPKDQLQLIKRRIIDNTALKTPVATALTDVDDLPFNIQPHGQVGIVLTEASDKALLEAAADGVAYELEVVFYLLKDVSAGAVATNIKFEHHSKVVVQKLDGHTYVNNAVCGAFKPNAFAVTAFTNPLLFTAAELTSF